MADQGRRWHEETASEEALARTLAAVGPLMGRQERAEAAEPEPAFAQPDPAFARALRARLTGEEPATLNAVAARRLHAPAEDGAHRARPVWTRWRGRRIVWVGTAAAVLAAALIVVALVAVGPTTTVPAVLAALAIAVVIAVRSRLGQ
jgi:hypothetical protein